MGQRNRPRLLKKSPGKTGGHGVMLRAQEQACALTISVDMVAARIREMHCAATSSDVARA